MLKGQLPVNAISRARAVALLTVLAALSFLLVTFIATKPAGASSGGVGTFDGSNTAESGSTSGGDRELGKYTRLWERVSYRDRRWARRTSECESGGDPDALGSGGRYRGAFQFMRSTWESAPRSPGGDPIRYSYRTQAVVAVALKNRDGADHWPVCG
jgi:hypothetical protein